MKIRSNVLASVSNFIDNLIKEWFPDLYLRKIKEKYGESSVEYFYAIVTKKGELSQKEHDILNEIVMDKDKRTAALEYGVKKIFGKRFVK